MRDEVESDLISPYEQWPAWAHRDSWAGETKHACVVVGETPQRFRCQMRDAAFGVCAGAVILVPKNAVTRR